MSDQLAMQVHLERRALRLAFAKARRRAAEWQPAPMPERWSR